MATEKLQFDIKSVADLAGFTKASQASKDLATDLEDTRSNGQKVADALREVADTAATELAQAQSAAEKLGTALGPELASKMGQSGVDGLISDLKRAGLTFEEIETDAEQLADAIKHVDEVGSRLDGASAGAKDLASDLDRVDDSARRVGSGFDDVADRTGKARDATKSFAGNAIGDLAATSTGVGILGEGIGQLTEGVLEGGVGFKQLLTAGLGMGAAGIALNAVMGAVADHQASIEASKAWNRKRVDDFTEAIRGAEGAAVDLRDVLGEGEKIEFFIGEDDEKKAYDAVDSLALLGIKYQEFSELVTGGGRDIMIWQQDMVRNNEAIGKFFTDGSFSFATGQVEQYTAALASSDPQVHAYGEVLAAMYQAHMQYGDATTTAADRQAVFGDKVDESTVATDNGATSLDSYTDSMDHAGEAARESAAKTDEFEQSLLDADTAYSTLMGKLDATQAWRNAQEAINQYNLTMLDSKRTDGEKVVAQEEVIKSLATYVAGLDAVPPEKKTQIYGALDRGDIDRATQLIEDIPDDVKVPVSINTFQADVENERLRQRLGREVVVPVRTSGSGGGGRYTPVAGATGGIVTKPTFSLIGENGPEAVIPLNTTPGSSPLPAGFGLGSGPQIVNNITINTGADPNSVIMHVKKYIRLNGHL